MMAKDGSKDLKEQEMHLFVKYVSLEVNTMLGMRELMEVNAENGHVMNAFGVQGDQQKITAKMKQGRKQALITGKRVT